MVFSRFPLPRQRPFLEKLALIGDKLIVNDAGAQLKFGSKRNLLEFPTLTAPTMISTWQSRR